MKIKYKSIKMPADYDEYLEVKSSFDLNQKEVISKEFKPCGSGATSTCYIDEGTETTLTLVKLPNRYIECEKQYKNFIVQYSLWQKYAVKSKEEDYNAIYILEPVLCSYYDERAEEHRISIGFKINSNQGMVLSQKLNLLLKKFNSIKSSFGRGKENDFITDTLMSLTNEDDYYQYLKVKEGMKNLSVSPADSPNLEEMMEYFSQLESLYEDFHEKLDKNDILSYENNEENNVKIADWLNDLFNVFIACFQCMNLDSAVFCDVKFSNIFLTSDGIARFVDYDSIVFPDDDNYDLIISNEYFQTILKQLLDNGNEDEISFEILKKASLKTMIFYVQDYLDPFILKESNDILDLCILFLYRRFLSSSSVTNAMLLLEELRNLLVNKMKNGHDLFYYTENMRYDVKTLSVKKRKEENKKRNLHNNVASIVSICNFIYGKFGYLMEEAEPSKSLYEYLTRLMNKTFFSPERMPYVNIVSVGEKGSEEERYEYHSSLYRTSDGVFHSSVMNMVNALGQGSYYLHSSRRFIGVSTLAYYFFLESFYRQVKSCHLFSEMNFIFLLDCKTVLVNSLVTNFGNALKNIYSLYMNSVSNVDFIVDASGVDIDLSKFDNCKNIYFFTDINVILLWRKEITDIKFGNLYYEKKNRKIYNQFVLDLCKKKNCNPYEICYSNVEISIVTYVNSNKIYRVDSYAYNYHLKSSFFSAHEINYDSFIFNNVCNIYIFDTVMFSKPGQEEKIEVGTLYSEDTGKIIKYMMWLSFIYYKMNINLEFSSGYDYNVTLEEECINAGLLMNSKFKFFACVKSFANTYKEMSSINYEQPSIIFDDENYYYQANCEMHGKCHGLKKLIFADTLIPAYFIYKYVKIRMNELMKSFAVYCLEDKEKGYTLINQDKMKLIEISYILLKNKRLFKHLVAFAKSDLIRNTKKYGPLNNGDIDFYFDNKEGDVINILILLFDYTDINDYYKKCDFKLKNYELTDANFEKTVCFLKELTEELRDSD